MNAAEGTAEKSESRWCHFGESDSGSGVEDTAVVEEQCSLTTLRGQTDEVCNRASISSSHSHDNHQQRRPSWEIRSGQTGDDGEEEKAEASPRGKDRKRHVSEPAESKSVLTRAKRVRFCAADLSSRPNSCPSNNLFVGSLDASRARPSFSVKNNATAVRNQMRIKTTTFTVPLDENGGGGRKQTVKRSIVSNGAVDELAARPAQVIQSLSQALAMNKSPTASAAAGVRRAVLPSTQFIRKRPSSAGSPDVQVIDYTSATATSEPSLERAASTSLANGAASSEELNKIEERSLYGASHVQHFLTKPLWLKNNGCSLRSPADLDLTDTKFDEKGHQCLECGEKFVLRSSLELHTDRPSFTIAVTCKLCVSHFEFKNRCLFVAHARRQHNLGPAAVFGNVSVSQFSKGQKEAYYKRWYASKAYERMTDLLMLYNYEFGQSSDGYKPVPMEIRQLLQAPSSDLETGAATSSSAYRQKLNELGERKEAQLQSVDALECTECQSKYVTEAQLRRHFVLNLPPNEKQLICPKGCQAVYFSRCSLSAHLRTHRWDSPYTCPECGWLSSTRNDLIRHMKEHRFSPSVMNAWQCEKCSQYYSNFDILVNHCTTHCVVVHSCSRCRAELTSRRDLINHSWLEHKCRMAPSSSVVYRCSWTIGCSAIAESKAALIQHLRRSHLANPSSFQIFRCPICGRLLENKIGLVVHFDKQHQMRVLEHELQGVAGDEKVVAVELESNFSASSSLPSKSVSPANVDGGGQVNFSNKPRCPRCDKELSNEFLLRLHLKMEHGESLTIDEIKSKFRALKSD